MVRKLRAPRLAPPANVEQLAAAAKAARQQACIAELDKATKAICEKHNCQQMIVVDVGGVIRPLSEVLSLPVAVLISPLDAKA